MLTAREQYKSRAAPSSEPHGCGRRERSLEYLWSLTQTTGAVAEEAVWTGMAWVRKANRSRLLLGTAVWTGLLCQARKTGRACREAR